MPGKNRNRLCSLLLAAALLIPAPAGAAYATLRPGAMGQEVEQMQDALTSLGYTVGAYGLYDSDTWGAVLLFQRDQGLTPDGLAGNATLTRLYAAVSQENAAPTAAPAAGSVLQIGSSGSTVRSLQNRLKLLGYEPDTSGVFSAATQSAVASFQQDFGLSSTGRADQATQARLADAAEGVTTTAVVTTSGGALTVRSARSTLSSALAYLPNSSTVGVVDYESTWTLIRWHNRQGYVMTRYLILGESQPAPTAAPTARPTQAPVSMAKVHTSGGLLTLRETQSMAAAALARIAYGQNVQVLEKGEVWTKVVYSGKTGYVLTRYLQFTEDMPTAAPTAAPVRTPVPARTTAAPVSNTYAVVTGGRLNLRATASSRAVSLLYIPNGATVTVLSRGATWSRVTYSGTAGYVMTRYLSFISATATPYVPFVTRTPAPTNTPVPVRTATAAPSWEGESGTARVTGGRLILRSYASTSAGSLIAIPNGATVVVLSRGAVWSRVSYGGMSGYVMSRYLVFASAPTAGPVWTPVRTATPAPTSVPTWAPVVTAEPSNPGGSGTAVVNVTSGGLNLRAYASTSAKVLTGIPDGTTVNVLDRGAVWSQVAYGGFTGYALNQYLTFIGSSWATATPAPTAAPVSPSSGYDTSILTRTLRSGYTGSDVNYVQQRLKALGYLSTVTGTYDSATMDAVRRFQSMHGLSQDGIAGAKTFTALFAASAQPYSSDITQYSAMRINYGDSVADSASVTKMQRALQQLGYTVTVNGKFDELTHNAVVQFQMRNGLTTSGTADAATQRILYSGRASGATATPVLTIGANENIMTVPSVSQVQLLHWYNVVKPSLTTGSTLKIVDPKTGTWWNLRVYSRGRHCDSEPQTLRDTLLMNRAFGKTGWTVHVVYVQLPDGRWTMATMHNRPHLNGSINDNGFDGHLCVHFLRDMNECRQYDPDYGVTNQETLREAWKALTGITVD